MTSRSFFLGLIASFGLAWLLVVVVPFFKMRDLKPIVLKEGVDTVEGATGPENTQFYFPKRTGRIANGAAVYAANGCYLCHTQVIRPTYAGNDTFRSDWAGRKDNGDGVDTRRETNAWDFQYEKFAQIGTTRLGPDFSNLGHRIEDEYAKGSDPARWLYQHLLDPRLEVDRESSKCPSFRYLFDEVKIQGNLPEYAFNYNAKKKTALVPDADAKALVSYLLSLKKDDAVPAVLSFGPKKEAATASAAPAKKN